VKTSEDRVRAAADSVDPDRWMVTFDDLMHRIASRFGRIEPRRTAGGYVRGLLSDIERKNCWNLAEQAGLTGPQAMQRLLRTACWDADAVRDDVRGYVTEHLGGSGVLIVDETGFLKKGNRSAGVQRQYTGTAGRIENSQVGVFLAYATPRGRALIDRRLYLPEHSWLADQSRCRAAGVPAQTAFATKPALAVLLRRNLTTGELAFYRCYAPSPTPLPTLVPSPASAGRSRSPSRPPRARSGWTTTKSAAGKAGTGTSPWPCSPWPSWRLWPPPNSMAKRSPSR
jgi:SRSO17 transposase